VARRESSATSDRQGRQNHIERDALRGQTFTFNLLDTDQIENIQNAYARARTEFRAEMLGVLEGFLSQEDAEKDPEYALFNQLYQMAMTAGRKSDIFIHVQGISENEVVLRVYQRFELESGETIYYAGGEFSYNLDENFGKIYRYEI
jgi:hypothetical protein